MEGINITINDNELVIKGSKEDLESLSKYISDISNSSNNKDHLHLDELTLIDKNSQIKNLIIEKE